MNEELQASNDELEGAREETQSVNQELHAVNSELRASLGERDVAHLDLLHLFSCNPNPAIFLDREQRIRQFTPSATEVFHLLPGDKGRPLVDIRSRLSDWDLSLRCQEVCQTLQVHETLLSRCEPDSPDRSYQTRILPYLNLDNRLDGVVLSFVDVSELQMAKSQTERRERQLSAVARLGSLISGEKSLDWLYDQALRKVSQVLSVEVACLLRSSAESQSIEVVCARGLDPGEHIRISELPALAETMRTGRTVTASKPSRGGRWSAVTTRIAEADERPWALGAFSRQAREFTFDEVDFLESVAFLLGTAQARSQEHLLNVLDRLVATAMTSTRDFLGAAPAMLAGLGNALAASQCQLWLAQPGGSKLSRSVTFAGKSSGSSDFAPAGQPSDLPACAEELVAAVWKARIPICLDGSSANARRLDASPLSGAFAFPLLSGEERLGVLYCCLPRPIFCSQRLLAGLAVAGLSLGELIRRTRVESALREAARHKDGFLAMLGHELRNPLAAIRNGVQLTELAENQADRNEAMGIIDRQSSQMALLIDSLLDMNRIALGKVSLDAKAMDLSLLAQSVLDDKRPIFESRGLTLTFEPAAQPAWILGDKVRMVQVLDNLLGNSLKFTEGPGSVSLSLAVAAGSVVLAIKDSGQGLTPELASQVFEPFRQGDQSLARPHGGLGLGLALVKQIVELHGGRVTVSSQGHNQGCEFSIVLAGIAVPAAFDGQTAQTEGPLVPQSILLIEDDLDLALSLGRLLEQSGHEVRHALDGQVALDLVRAKTPGVVLCDLGLPGDLDGLALLTQLRAVEGMLDVPVIAMTGYGLASDKARSMKAGFWIHLTKPFEVRELQAILGGLSRYPGALRLPRPGFCRILVVDDNAMIAQATSRLLEKAGFEARHAFSAGEALQVVDEWIPHLAILDLGLPDRSGYELKAALCALACCRDCVFLAMTGSDESEDVEKTHLAGFVAHLTKPVSLERLLQELDRLCPLFGTGASRRS
jgi:two-component system CheB/CheR fusion protein